MAIRIRNIEDKVVALCAAESTEQAGDIYLDDNAHHALTVKFESDFKEMGFLKEEAERSKPAQSAEEFIRQEYEVDREYPDFFNGNLKVFTCIRLMEAYAAQTKQAP